MSEPFAQSKSGPGAGFELAVLYDGQCAVCTATAQGIARRDDGKRIELLDLQQPEVAERFAQFSPMAVRAQLHAVNPSGTVFIGIDALDHVGRHLAGWRWLVPLLRVPGLRQLADFGYRVFARNRLVFNPLLGKTHDPCESGACAIDWDALEAEQNKS